jgi:hypothetical protein
MGIEKMLFPFFTDHVAGNKYLPAWAAKSKCRKQILLPTILPAAFTEHTAIAVLTAYLFLSVLA